MDDMMASNLRARSEFVGRTADREIQDLYLGRQLDANQRPTYFGPFHGKRYLDQGKWSSFKRN